MKLKEAYSILEVPEGTSANDAKKKYRELSKKFHPDVNKEPGAEDKFKKINEAYARIQKGGSDESEMNHSGFNPFDNFGGFDLFRNNTQSAREVKNIIINTNLTFSESILGIKKEISFTRINKCSECSGQGHVLLNNGCDKCGGKGQVTRMQGNMVFIQTCNQCMGRVNRKSCEKCSSTGCVNTDVTLSVNIPGGVSNGNILRLAGMGNFAGQFMSMDQFSDAHLIINVESHPELRLENDYVICNLHISLLEALRGCTKIVPTVIGSKEIVVPPLAKNKDELIIPRVGVNSTGDQKILIDIKYPQNTNKLIDTLLELEEK